MYTLLHGDCLELLPTLKAGSVDAIVTDPPYLEGDFSFLLPELERVAQRVVLTPGKIESFNWIARKRPFWEYCWRMSSTSLGGQACLHIGWEPILAYQPPIAPIGNDVFSFTQKIFNNTNGVHKWPKPIELMRFLVTRWTRPGDTVLDPFMGSGTTGVACVQTGRNFVGIELDPGYFAIAQRRIADAAAQPRLFDHEEAPAPVPAQAALL